MNKDLFGNDIVKDVILRDEYQEPPFSVLDTKQGSWQNRKRAWIGKGLKSEIGRDSVVLDIPTKKYSSKEERTTNYVSVFDPVLCELMYKWFCDDGGRILDPFAGGSVRGIVAAYLGYKYTGIDLREEQIKSNYEQAEEMVPDNKPEWIVGDSNVILSQMNAKPEDRVCDGLTDEFDFVFSCPPYFDLEVYSDLPDDLSNMDYPTFLATYEAIISKACGLLKPKGYACFVVGEVRDANGNYIGFVPDTIKAFQKAGMAFYNDAILLNPVASASMRAANNMKHQKLTKIHQNVLVFKKC